MGSFIPTVNQCARQLSGAQEVHTAQDGCLEPLISQGKGEAEARRASCVGKKPQVSSDGSGEPQKGLEQRRDLARLVCD